MERSPCKGPLPATEFIGSARCRINSTAPCDFNEALALEREAWALFARDVAGEMPPRRERGEASELGRKGTLMRKRQTGQNSDFETRVWLDTDMLNVEPATTRLAIRRRLPLQGTRFESSLKGTSSFRTAFPLELCELSQADWAQLKKRAFLSEALLEMPGNAPGSCFEMPLGENCGKTDEPEGFMGVTEVPESWFGGKGDGSVEVEIWDSVPIWLGLSTISGHT